MWTRSKKAMLAIEWIWLLIGTAAVFAHLVEAWASPYLPALWMLGVLGLFLAYRVGIAVREVYWPEPEVEPEEQPVTAGKRRGGDGMVSTTEWVPPHIRGRNNEKRQKQQATEQAAEQLELPSASGRFDGADIATAFNEVDEDTDPQPTAIVDVGIPFESTSIVEVDKASLRPETQADVSQNQIIIPSFAESALTGDERKRAIETRRDEEITDTNPVPKQPAPTKPSPTKPSPTKPSPRPPAIPEPAAPDDDTNPMRVKDTRSDSDGQESK